MTLCTHYNRNCSFVAPCCNKIYGCRHCHDYIENNIIENNNIIKPESLIENKPKSHMLDRTSIKEVVCNLCETRQNVSNFCINCNTIFGSVSLF